ncbi:MAG: aspartyl/asparaginyl beta-hydroxylase domain-containing protein [Pseudomonadota bacterium]
MRKYIIKGGKHLLRWFGEFQAKHSKVPTTPFIDNAVFPWVPALEAESRAIRAELDQLLEHPEDIPAFHQLSPDQKRISKGNNWKTFGFYVMGNRLEENCAVCPQTAAALERIPDLQNAWFSILAPEFHILPHRGPTRALVRVHLALRVPERAEDCWIRVDEERYHWREGEVVLFDDTYEHEVYNNTDEVRVVLFIDVLRPMDRVGQWVNGTLLALLKSSTYVKKPLENLREWNRTHPPRGNAG